MKAESVEVLVATMNQIDNSLLEKMNIQTNAIIGNQCTNTPGRFDVFEEVYHEHHITWLNFSEKGVGLNRNNTLMRAKADIVVFADDDMQFFDGYEKVVLTLFQNNPKADVIIFNLGGNAQVYNKNEARFTKKVGFATHRIACRKEVIHKNGILFNLCFGGGAEYSCGEDTLFLVQCVRLGLNIYCVPQAIAKLTDERPSTWFFGYTEKYFIDVGILFAVARISFPLLRIVKASYIATKKCNFGFYKIFCLYLKGYRQLKLR